MVGIVQSMLAGGQPAPQGAAMPAAAAPQAGGETNGATQAGGETNGATQALADLLKEVLSEPTTQEAIVGELQEGADDLEMTTARIAARLLKGAVQTVKNMQRSIPPDTLSQVAAMVVAKLLEMAQQAQVPVEGDPKLLARRTLALAVQVFRHGERSVK